MKKLAGLGLALLLMAGCTSVETSEEESKAESPKVEEPVKQAKEPEPKPAVNQTAEYDAKVSSMLGGLSITMSDFSQTLIDGSSDPLLMVSEEYHRDLQAVCDRMYAEIQEFKSLDVPAERKAMHDRLLDALSHYEIVALDTPAAVENLDADRLMELTDEILAGNEKVVSLTNDLQ